MIASVLLIVLATGSPPDSTPVRPAADTLAAVADTLSPVRPPPGDRPSVADTVTVLPELRVHPRPDDGHAARRLPTSFAREVQAGSTGHAFETVTELLARSPGVRVGQYGGLGAFSTVTVRGSRAGQVSIYLDGAPMTSASRSVVNLSDLPTTLLRRVEIYPAPPLDLGPATPGGAINFVTPSDVRRQHVYATRGSFGTWGGLATVGGAGDAWSGLFHVGAQGSRGDFSFLDDNGTPINTTDDENAHRQNNALEATTVLARGAWTPRPNVRFNARGNLFAKEQGLPGRGAVPALHTRLAMRLTQAVAEAERGATGPWPTVRLRYVNDGGRSQLRDTGNELKLGAHDTDDRTRSDMVSAFAAAPRLPGGITVEGSGSIRIEGAELHDAADRFPDPPSSRRVSRGASLTLRLEPWRDVLMLQAGRRWDRQHDELRSLTSFGTLQASDVTHELSTPQLGARLRPGAGFELRGNWWRTVRAPEFLELFGNQGSVAGNPLLPPEHAESWDAGGGWSLDMPALRVSATAAHYESTARDLIEYVRNTPNSVRAQSISRARIRGQELGLSATTSFGVVISGSLTLQTARDEGDVPHWHGRWLPLEPQRQGYASVLWRSASLQVAADVEVIGRTYVDRANREPSPSRTLPGVSVSARMPWDMRLTVEGKNLGDVRAFDIANYPLPGRSLFASCEWALGPGSTSRP